MFGVPTVRNIIILHLFYFILLPVLKVFINQMLHTFICSLCFYHLVFVKSIFDDIALSDASDFKCNECGKSFLTESDLTGHKQLHRRQQREKTMFSYEMIVILITLTKIVWSWTLKRRRSWSLIHVPLLISCLK